MAIEFSRIPSDSLLGRAVRLPLRILPKEWAVPILQGSNRGHLWIIGSGVHGYWFGCYELAKQRAIAEVVKPGMVFYDVGANVGFYTLLASRLVGEAGKVVAFEPSHRNLAFLRRHVGMNRCGNVQIYPAAVADRKGKGRFNAGTDPSTGRLDESGRAEVELVSLDELVDSGEILPPNVIKMDIEGGEGAALRGAARVLRGYQPTLFVSIHGRKTGDDVKKTLLSMGCEIIGLNEAEVDKCDEWIARGRPRPNAR